MDIMELGAIGELVGGLAVIGSLIFVGVQVRQNTRVETAATHRAILEEVSRCHRMVVEYADAVHAGLSNFQGLSHRDKLIFTEFIQTQVTWFESVPQLPRRKLLDAVMFPAARDYVLAFILTPGGAEWWQASKAIWDPRVREFLGHTMTHDDDLPAPIRDITQYGTLVEA